MIYAQKCDMYTYMYTRAFYMYFWTLEVSVLFTWLCHPSMRTVFSAKEVFGQNYKTLIKALA